MLDAYIIEELKRQEQEKKDSERPRLYIQIDDRPPREEDYKIDIPYDDQKEEEKDGKIVINMCNSYMV